MTQDNPFRVLGLDPSALRGLTDVQIARLVKGVYKALQGVHHPDVGGKLARSVAINKAYESLDPETRVPVVYEAAKQQFLKPGSAQRRIEERDRIVKSFRTEQITARQRWLITLMRSAGHMSVQSMEGKVLDMYDAVAGSNAGGRQYNERDSTLLNFKLRVEAGGRFSTLRKTQRGWRSGGERRLFGSVDNLDTRVLWDVLYSQYPQNRAPSAPEKVLGETMYIPKWIEANALGQELSFDHLVMCAEHISATVAKATNLLSCIDCKPGEERETRFFVEGRVLGIS